MKSILPSIASCLLIACSFPATSVVDRDSKSTDIKSTDIKSTDIDDEVVEVVKGGLAHKPIEKKGKFGYVDKEGRLVIAPIYDSAGEFQETMAKPLAKVKKNNKFGVIDHTGKIIVPIKYDNIDWIEILKHGSLAAIENEYAGETKYGLFDSTGSILIEPTYKSIKFNFDRGWVQSTLGDKRWALIDNKGKVLTAFKYVDSYGRVPKVFEKDQIAVEVLNTDRALSVYVTKFGDEYEVLGVNPPDKTTSLLLVAKRDGRGDLKYGYINKETGKLVVGTNYDYADDFSDSLAVVRKNKKYGYINMQGEIALPLKYSHASPFENGQAIVEVSDGRSPGMVRIDKKGNVLTKNRILLSDFRRELSISDSVRVLGDLDLNDGVVSERKGNAAKIGYYESQCSQRDNKGSCINYVRTQAYKWIKMDKIYPLSYYDYR